MLYTKFVRTNRSNTHEGTNRTWHEYAREARAQGTAHGRVRTRTRHAHASRRFTHDYARIGTARTAAAHGHSRRAQVAGHRGKVITICDKLGSTQSQVAVAGRRHTHPAHEHESHEHGHESYGTDHESYRSRHESHRYAYESHRHGNTYTGRSRQSQLQVTGAGSRSSRGSHANRTGQGSAQVPARSTQPRAGAGQEQDRVGMRHRSQVTARRTRHDTSGNTARHRYTRYDTIPIHTIRSRTIHARRTRQAAGHAYDTHVNALRITYDTHDTHGTAPQHSTAGRPTHGTRLHAYAQ
jgi:hypothetical protein